MGYTYVRSQLEPKYHQHIQSLLTWIDAQLSMREIPDSLLPSLAPGSQGGVSHATNASINHVKPCVSYNQSNRFLELLMSF